MKKEKKEKRNLTRKEKIILAILSPFAAIVVLICGLFAYMFVAPIVADLIYHGEPDRLDDSWGQINQPIEKPAGWRQIVRDSQFQLGGVQVQYGLDEGAETYHFDDVTYPAIDGSTVMVPLAMEFARQHLRLDGRALEKFVWFSTTPTAYEKLFNRFGEADYVITEQPNPKDWEYISVRSPRPLDLFLGTLYSDNELALATRNGVEPVARPICRDAFVFITGKDNPVESLTLEQVKGIFSGEITNWKDVGGANEKILAFQREPGSGSQTGMEQLVMQGAPMAPAEKVNVVQGMGMLIEAVAEYRNSVASIGYSYRYYIDNQYSKENVKQLQINGVVPTDENIINGTYPLSVNYYGVIRAGEEQGPGGLFLDWILSEEGQACVKQAGYIPLEATP